MRNVSGMSRKTAEDNGKKQVCFFLLVVTIFLSLPCFSGMEAPAGYRVVSVIWNVLTAVFSYLCFFGIFRERTVSFLCSALYLFSVYRISVLYVRGDLTRAGLMAALPLVLYLLIRLYREEILRKAGYAAVFFLTCALWYAAKSAGRLILHDVPDICFQEKGLYPAQLALHFWTVGVYEAEYGKEVYKAAPMGIGFLLIFGLVLFFCLWYGGAFRGAELEFCAKTAFVLSTLLLLMSLNSFPWDYLQRAGGRFGRLISGLESPACFLSWGTLLTVFLCGFLLRFFQEKSRVLYLAGIFIVIVGIMTSGVYLLDYIVGSQETPYQYRMEEGGFEEEG